MVKKMKYEVEVLDPKGWVCAKDDIDSMDVAVNLCAAFAFVKKESRIVRVLREMIVSPMVANYHAGA